MQIEKISITACPGDFSYFLGKSKGVMPMQKKATAQKVNINNQRKNTNPYFLKQEDLLLDCLVRLIKADPQGNSETINQLLSLDEKQLNRRFKNAYKKGKISLSTYQEWKTVVSSKLYEYISLGLWTKL